MKIIKTQAAHSGLCFFIEWEGIANFARFIYKPTIFTPERIVIQMLFKRMTCLWAMTLLVLVIFLTPTCLAEDHPPLPWGLTWESSVRETIEVIQTHTASAPYTIQTARGDYIVDITSESNDQAILYRAQYQGAALSDTIEMVTLGDIEDQGLTFKWLGIDYSPLGREADTQKLTNGDAIKAFERLFAQFAQTFGQGTDAYSYIKTTTAGTDTTYALPKTDGSIDFAAISRHLAEKAPEIETYWLVIGDGHAACRLYVSALMNRGDASAGILLHLSLYFTKDVQTEFSHDAQASPQLP